MNHVMRDYFITTSMKPPHKTTQIIKGSRVDGSATSESDCTTFPLTKLIARLSLLRCHHQIEYYIFTSLINPIVYFLVRFPIGF